MEHKSDILFCRNPVISFKLSADMYCTTSPLWHLFYELRTENARDELSCDTAILAQSSDSLPYSVLAPVLKHGFHYSIGWNVCSLTLFVYMCVSDF